MPNLKFTVMGNRRGVAILLKVESNKNKLKLVTVKYLEELDFVVVASHCGKEDFMSHNNS